MKDQEIDEWTAALAKPDGAFDPPENNREKFVNTVRASVLGEDDPDMVEIRMPELRAAAATLVYAGHDPKHVPNDVMKFCIQNPPDIGRGFIHMDARRRVRNPNTAIRAMCLECQGNDQVAVRQCPSINCMLWPFRMAGNPFFGRLVGSTGEEEAHETEEEIEAMEQEREAAKLAKEQDNANS